MDSFFGFRRKRFALELLGNGRTSQISLQNGAQCTGMHKGMTALEMAQMNSKAEVAALLRE